MPRLPIQHSRSGFPERFIPMEYVYTSVDAGHGVVVVTLTRRGVDPPPAILLGPRDVACFIYGLQIGLHTLEGHPLPASSEKGIQNFTLAEEWTTEEHEGQGGYDSD